MLAKLLSNYPLNPVAIHCKLENALGYRDCDASLAKYILAEFQSQLFAVKSRAAIKQRNDLMLE